MITRLIIALIAYKAGRAAGHAVAAAAYVRGAVDTLDHLPDLCTTPSTTTERPTA